MLRLFNKPIIFRRSLLQNGVNLLSAKFSNTQKLTNEKETESEFSGYIPIDKINFTYSRSSGPGGQHVNTVNSKVELRFHVPTASWIPETTRNKLLERETARINKQGYLVMKSELTRKQLLNQADCLDRVRRLIRECESSMKDYVPTPEQVEIKTKRIAKANQERLQTKRKMSVTKATRQKPSSFDI